MQTFVERNGKTESYPGAATEWVRDYFRDRKLARRSGLVPFAGGAVGYIAYDAAQWFEPALRDDNTHPLDGPIDAVWMFYRTVLAFDRVKQRLEIVSIVFTEEAGGSHDRLRELYDEAVGRTKEIEQTIFETTSTPQSRPREEPAVAIQLDAPRVRRCGATDKRTHRRGRLLPGRTFATLLSKIQR
jgi:anthranilate synthase component 1